MYQKISVDERIKAKARRRNILEKIFCKISMERSISTVRILEIIKNAHFPMVYPGGGGYSYIFPYGDMPLNRVSFSGFRLQDRVSFL